MTDEQRKAIESGIAALEKCGWTHRIPVLRALLATASNEASDANSLENIAAVMGRNSGVPSQFPIAYLSTEPRYWDRCRIKPGGSFTVPVFGQPAKPCLHVRLNVETCEDCGAKFELV